ncbi:hypothetical protein BHU72_02285 [Desulfuribacillus stibiiarsenatis]|uniref:DUF2619 domain-containing protein n=1 Tax=Desulfuribacillus stibiiarsenatis TaxID=1390249 RepID=A0A1E5L6A7_9FIRM|nr:YqhV family protein [Desulfuribacillus stibiiarsenatis]OEH85646.1 hypothetical protein BHU72_02285 [Desulfuribacillus stibiiarsenatis]
MEKIALGMGSLRLLSGTIEVTAAILMIYFGTVERAMMINAGLAIVGPTVLILVTALGLFGLAGEISFVKLVLVFSGAILILIGLWK